MKLSKHTLHRRPTPEEYGILLNNTSTTPNTSKSSGKRPDLITDSGKDGGKDSGKDGGKDFGKGGGEDSGPVWTQASLEPDPDKKDYDDKKKPSQKPGRGHPRLIRVLIVGLLVCALLYLILEIYNIYRLAQLRKRIEQSRPQSEETDRTETDAAESGSVTTGEKEDCCALNLYTPVRLRAGSVDTILYAVQVNFVNGEPGDIDTEQGISCSGIVYEAETAHHFTPAVMNVTSWE